MKRVGILLSFAVIGSLYGAENVTINAGTPKSQYEPYLQRNPFSCHFNLGKKNGSYSGNTLIWNDTPPDIDEGKGLFIYGGQNDDYIAGNRDASDNKVYINGGDNIQWSTEALRRRAARPSVTAS